MPNRVLIDTWGWVALGHRKDPHHLDVQELYKEWREASFRIYTTDYIVDEVMTLLFRREVFGEAVRFMEALSFRSPEGW